MMLTSGFVSECVMGIFYKEDMQAKQGMKSGCLGDNIVY